MQRNNRFEIVAVIHNVRSVHNVGSMFRTADGAGIKKLYLSGFTPGPLDRFGKVRTDFKKVSLGAEASVEWESVRSVTTLIKKLKKDGYVVCAVEQAPRARNIFTAARYLRARRIAIIVGNEVRGLSPSIVRSADHVLEIPMYGSKESLNVSVAFGIAVYALRD
ncbi:MAG: TrmH family RNA methyltransferase [bacterium]|nr:TrmH family RNA methyltransferase [bacterium]